jgi:hypothetical protein
MPAATATVTATTAPPVAPVAAIPPINGWTTIYGITINPNIILLAVIVGCVLYFIWKAQRSQDPNSFDFSDLVMDDITSTAETPDRTRKASVIKLTYLCSFIFSTWLVYDQEIKLSPQLPTVFGLWMATWAVAVVAKLIFDKKDAPTFTLPGAKP